MWHSRIFKDIVRNLPALSVVRLTVFIWKKYKNILQIKLRWLSIGSFSVLFFNFHFSFSTTIDLLFQKGRKNFTFFISLFLCLYKKEKRNIKFFLHFISTSMIRIRRNILVSAAVCLLRLRRGEYVFAGGIWNTVIKNGEGVQRKCPF